MIITSTFETKLGKMLAAVENDQLIGLWFTDQNHYPKQMEKEACDDSHPLFSSIKMWLNDYFDGKVSTVEISLAPKGTEFQQLVWKYLLEIPFGQTTTYGHIANKVAQSMGRESMSAQAVGGAVGRNPISIIIPCHRVIGANKSLTGYDGGLHRKEFLLTVEKIEF